MGYPVWVEGRFRGEGVAMTHIPYLTEHWGVISGCSGKGCKVKAHCWAKDMVRRFPAIHGIKHKGKIYLGMPFEVPVFHPDRLEKPLHWKKPRRIGVCFMGDMFDEQVKDSWLYEIYPMMVKTDWHTYFVLTKQVKRMAQWISDTRNAWIGRMDHIWHGVSITAQPDADRMLPDLLRIPGKHWISIEPMLGSIYLLGAIGEFVNVKPDRLTGTKGDFVYKGEIMDKLNLIVLGCESGPKRRPCPQSWMIDVVHQCDAAGVKCYVKQVNINGKVERDINKFPPELRVRQI